MKRYALSVVIAVERATQNLPAILANCQPLRYPQVEFLICAGEEEGEFASFDSLAANVRVLKAAVGRRIPHLWRDGIRAASAPFVATMTAHCVPDPDWVGTLLDTPLGDDVAGIGGVIENAPGAGALDWAIYLQRYGQYTPDRLCGDSSDIAADNALYRRDGIMEQSDLLEDGFWEPNFHARFRAARMRLRIDPNLCVIHHNLYSLRDYLQQRVTHGTEFGFSRAARHSLWRRVLLLSIAPGLAGLFLAKILIRSSRSPYSRRGVRVALPLLVLCVSAWGWGEARGYLNAIRSGCGGSSARTSE